MDHIQTLAPKFKDITCIAHNNSGYDGHFILREMAVERGWTPEIISNGAKLLHIKHGTLRFIDSLNYLCAPLAKLPKMMNIEGELEKGFFPHMFNRPENQNFVGPLCEIPLDNFTPDAMSTEARKEITEWYYEMVAKNYIFNFQVDILKYCKQDILILSLACLIFRKKFLKETTVDPFRDCITIAAACMLTFQKLFLKENSIGIIPKNGYRSVDNQSRVALQWLEWIARSRNFKVQHAGNGREMVPEGLSFKVDGFVEQEKLILEFNGCWFHGCPLCYKEGRDEPIQNAPDETMNLRYEKTVSCETQILQTKDEKGNPRYKLESIWECEFKRLLDSDPNVRQFCDSATEWYLLPPLKPNDAFFGGRTNAVRLFYEANLDAGESVAYDVTSLYPYVCKYGVIPVGHPQILVGKDCENVDINNYVGLIKCSVLPPDDLYHPVLPYRSNGKLMFPLCRTCADTLCDSECAHNEAERTLLGTWVSLELQKAVEMGYIVTKVEETWHYETSQFNGQHGGIFREYIDKFLKLKQEHSGWPSWCKNDSDKSQYISDYMRKEGIALDPDNIQSNPGFRSIAKLLLNSFWGKWGQRSNFGESKFVKGKVNVQKLFLNPSLKIQSLEPISDNLMLVNVKSIDEAIVLNKKSNVVIAAFVTAQARLKLYSHLQELGRRVLYFDTDSVFYTCAPGEKLLERGDFLGQMTNELEEYGPKSFISTFVSSGPKAYCYEVCVNGDRNDRKTVCKIRGITLNYRASQVVNFDSIKRMVLGETTDPIIVHNPHKIVRGGSADWYIYTKPEDKIYRVVYNKRRRLPDSYDMLPFGTKRRRLV